MNKIAVENVAFCEDVRQEVGGKYTLLGVFAPELSVREIPATMSLAIWISGTPSQPGLFTADFRALDVDKNSVISGKMEGEFSSSGKSSVVIGPMPLPIQKEGEYTFEWKFADNKWEKIGTLRIHHTVEGQPASAT
jgi:hypothetical protein